jgi:PIN domain nuclease of toxin-antitoxin system
VLLDANVVLTLAEGPARLRSEVVDMQAHHGDPFDRLLIAQAQVEVLPIVTTDRSFARYGVDVIDAR